MRHPYTGKKFFSLYEHVDVQQMQELLSAATNEMRKLELKVGVGNQVYHVGCLIRLRPENAEVHLNNIIGIA